MNVISNGLQKKKEVESIMKILALADIHQMNDKWKRLVGACKKESPDIVAIAGDIFPKGNGIREQLEFVVHLKKYARQIKETGAKLILTLGNDDNQLLIEDMKVGNEQGYWHYINDCIVEINGYEFVGMSYVVDHPFGYKYWCRGEYNDVLRIDSEQRSKPLLINENNEFIFIENYEKFLADQPSLWDVLISLKSRVKDMKKSIWLIHQPPSDLLLDVCAVRKVVNNAIREEYIGGKCVGSKAVYNFIHDNQPLLTIHGHIHESPEYNGHKWYHTWDDGCISIQNGQISTDLHYCIIDLECGKIKKMRHSIYG